MRGQRTERLVRLAAKFMLTPSKLVSLTDLAGKFNHCTDQDDQSEGRQPERIFSILHECIL